jgi:hypothetical protein
MSPPNSRRTGRRAVVPDEDAVVFSGDAASLSDDTIRELQDKFGLKLQVRSSHDAIASALNRLGEVAVQNFDRTNPSYGRVFDRTGAIENIRDQVINPVELENQIRRVAENVIRNRPAGPG